MRALAVVAIAVVACGGGRARTATTAHVEPARPVGATERILPLLPDGAQVVIEIDLARLRANKVVGSVVTDALGRIGAEARVPGVPIAVQGSPLAAADALVLASYGVGTAQAATVAVLATTGEVPGGTTIEPGIVALGPEEWVGPMETRAAIAAQHAGVALAAPKDFLILRDHAMPAGAPGAVLRVTARLPFDARISLARQLGIDAAPAQLSIWADVADDLAIVIDADATDPGDKAAKQAARHLAGTLRASLGNLADDPTVRALGFPASLTGARVITQGSWVRGIIAVGPTHLARVIERARAMLSGST